MRLGLVIVLCLLNTACAIVRKDKEEPVEDVPTRREKAEPVLKPSDALKPKGLEVASPVSDMFYMKGTYFTAAVTTEFAVDRSPTIRGTEMIGEEDLGWDDQVDQFRMEVDIRMKRRHHLRFDYFKLSRFQEVALPRDIVFGDFDFDEGTIFRSQLDWRVFTITHTYEFFKFDRWEAGGGLGIHIAQVDAEGGQPGTLNREEVNKVGIWPTLALSGSFRISKRWAITARGQYFAAQPEDFEGSMADYHADIQYRWRKNFAVGLGYSKLATHVVVVDTANPVLFDLDTAGPELFFRVAF